MLISGPAHGALTLNADGSFNYIAEANYTGADSFSYKVNDGALDSNVATVTINVAAVNDAPVASGYNYSIGEDTALNVTGIHAIDIDSSSLTTIMVSAPTHGTVTANGDGTFQYIPNADYNGVDSFSYKVNDGVLDSNVADVSIQVTSVNDSPSFSLAANTLVVNEDAAPQVIPGFAQDISAGSTDEANQSLYFIVTNDNNTLFILQPKIDSQGTLFYTLAPNANGLATLQVVLVDSGGIASGGIDSSTVKTFRINANPVNDAPSFQVGGTISSPENSGSQDVSGFVAQFSAGPIDESSQGLQFILSNDNGSLFSLQPYIDRNGDLSYTLAPNQHGIANVTVQMQDTGGTERGGIDVSEAHSFQIQALVVENGSEIHFTDQAAHSMAKAALAPNEMGMGSVQQDDSAFNIPTITTLSLDGAFTNLNPNISGFTSMMHRTQQNLQVAVDDNNYTLAYDANTPNSFVTQVTLPSNQDASFKIVTTPNTPRELYAPKIAHETTRQTRFASEDVFAPAILFYDGFLYRRRIKPVATGSQILFKQLIDGIWLSRMNTNELMAIADNANHCFQFCSQESIEFEKAICLIALGEECVELLGNLLLRAHSEKEMMLDERGLYQLMETTVNVAVKN